MAFTAIELGHDYLVLTDHSPRLKVAHGLSAERLARQLDVRRRRQRPPGRRRLPAAAGASRSTSSTTARSTRPTRCSRASTCGWPACTPSSRWTPTPMTRRMVGAVRNPRTNVLGHCTGRLVTGNRGTRAQSQFDARAVFDGLRRARRRGRDQLPPRAPRPPDRAARSWPSTPAASSPSTPTPTPRASSTSCRSAPSGPRPPASSPTGSSTPGRASGCWPGPTRARVSAWRASRPRWRYVAPPAAAARSRPTATARPIVVLDARLLHRRRGGRVGRARWSSGCSAPSSARGAHRRRPAGPGPAR